MTSLTRRESSGRPVSLREALDALFEESFVPSRGEWSSSGRGSIPAIDMYETEDDIIVQSPIPGVKAEDLDVTITGDQLTIRGQVEERDETEEERYILRERRYGSFCRSVTIPTRVKVGQVEAEIEDGMLTLTLPKAEEAKPRGIKVKTKKK